jgi:L-fuconolactonase
MIDTHAHVVSDDVVRYPRLASAPDGAPASELTALMPAVGVHRALLVQPGSVYGSDTRYCVDSARARPDLFGAVVPPPADLDRRDPAVLGWRLLLTDRDPSEAAAVLRAAASGRVPVLASLPAAMVDRLLALVRSRPDVRLVVDHAALPDLAGGPPYERAADLAALAAFPDVHVKLSSTLIDHVVAHDGEPWSFVDALVGWFGTGRVQWGSGWSLLPGRTYGELVDRVRWALGRVDAVGVADVLGGAAARFWFAADDPGGPHAGDVGA